MSLRKDMRSFDEYEAELAALRARNAVLERVAEAVKAFLEANPELNGTGPLRGEVAELEAGTP